MGELTVTALPQNLLHNLGRGRGGGRWTGKEMEWMIEYEGRGGENRAGEGGEKKGGRRERTTSHYKNPGPAIFTDCSAVRL